MPFCEAVGTRLFKTNTCTKGLTVRHGIHKTSRFSIPVHLLKKQMREDAHKKILFDLVPKNASLPTTVFGFKARRGIEPLVTTSDK